MHIISPREQTLALLLFCSVALSTAPCPPTAPWLPEQVELPPADLGPTASLTQTLSLLREVLASHDSSVVPLDARQADFAQVNTFLQYDQIQRTGNLLPILLNL